jgi:KUP system potassium uptake protein
MSQTTATAPSIAPDGATPSHRPRSTTLLALAALGVVFGDIGTSPLYAMQAIFTGDHPVRATASDVYGVISLVAWSLTLMVSIKFVVFIMRADNEGEGGVMALYALVRKTSLE